MVKKILLDLEQFRRQWILLTDFEEIRDEVLERIRQKYRRKMLDQSIYSQKDLGFKATAEVYETHDHCGDEVQKALNRVDESVKFQESEKDREVNKFLQKMSSKGLYEYLKLRKLLGLPKETFKIGPYTHLYFPQMLGFINPGGLVTIKNGTFTFIDKLKVPDNMVLTGIGPSTIIRLDGGIQKTVIENKNREQWVIGDNNPEPIPPEKIPWDGIVQKNIVIKDMIIDGEGQTGNWNYAIWFIKVDDCLVENVKMKNTYWENIWFWACKNSVVDKCLIESSGREGIAQMDCEGGGIFDSLFRNAAGSEWQALQADVSKNMAFVGNRMYNYQSGVVLWGCSHCTIGDTEIYSSKGDGLLFVPRQVDSTWYYPHHNVISGVTILDSGMLDSPIKGLSGLMLRQGYANEINGINIHRSRGHGIFTYYEKDLNITGGTITDSSMLTGHPNEYDGINLQASQNILILGVRSYDTRSATLDKTQRFGIADGKTVGEADPDYVAAIGCNLIGNRSASFVLVGQHDMVLGHDRLMFPNSASLEWREATYDPVLRTILNMDGSYIFLDPNNVKESHLKSGKIVLTNVPEWTV